MHNDNRNIAIARFLGFPADDKGYHWYHPLYYVNPQSMVTEYVPSHTDAYTCRFCIDSDWQISIVEEIEKGNFGFKMCRKVVEVYFDDSKVQILKVKEGSRRESLYEAIYKFALWYMEYFGHALNQPSIKTK